MHFRSFVRNCIYSGNKPYGIHNGIDGLINDEVRPIQWSDVTGWVVEVKGFYNKIQLEGLFLIGWFTFGYKTYTYK